MGKGSKKRQLQKQAEGDVEMTVDDKRRTKNPGGTRSRKKQQTIDASNKSRLANVGHVMPVDGFAVAPSISAVASVPGLENYAKSFAHQNRPMAKRSDKGEGDAMIEFDDPFSKEVKKKHGVDHRPQRIVYCKNGTERYPAAPNMEKKRSKHIAMINETIKRVTSDHRWAFGLPASKKCEVTKITLIAFGSQDQAVHTDANTGESQKGSGVESGTMIYNLLGRDCLIGTVAVGDPHEQLPHLAKQNNAFRHSGGVAFVNEVIPANCFAWLDDYKLHYGAVNPDSVRLHVHIREKDRNETLDEVQQVFQIPGDDLLASLKECIDRIESRVGERKKRRKR